MRKTPIVPVMHHSDHIGSGSKVRYSLPSRIFEKLSVKTDSRANSAKYIPAFRIVIHRFLLRVRDTIKQNKLKTNEKNRHTNNTDCSVEAEL